MLDIEVPQTYEKIQVSKLFKHNDTYNNGDEQMLLN